MCKSIIVFFCLIATFQNIKSSDRGIKAAQEAFNQKDQALKKAAAQRNAEQRRKAIEAMGTFCNNIRQGLWFTEISQFFETLRLGVESELVDNETINFADSEKYFETEIKQYHAHLLGLLKTSGLAIGTSLTGIFLQSNGIDNIGIPITGLAVSLVAYNTVAFINTLTFDPKVAEAFQKKLNERLKR